MYVHMLLERRGKGKAGGCKSHSNSTYDLRQLVGLNNWCRTDDLGEVETDLAPGMLIELRID